MRAKRSLPFKKKKAFVCVVDGKCELWYLSMLLRNEREIGFTLTPKIVDKKDVEQQYNNVIALATNIFYDKIFWVIDCDVVGEASRLAPKGTETEQQKLEKYIKKIESGDDKDRIVIIRNNPCLEYWLLLHFEDTAAPFTNCDAAGKRLKRKFVAYDKSQDFFTKDDHDIYLQLKPHLPTAIKHARKISKQAAGNRNASVSEMYRLFEELGLVEKD
jgi:hypothetical protein